MRDASKQRATASGTRPAHPAGPGVRPPVPGGGGRMRQPGRAGGVAAAMDPIRSLRLALVASILGVPAAPGPGPAAGTGQERRDATTLMTHSQANADRTTPVPVPPAA